MSDNLNKDDIQKEIPNDNPSDIQDDFIIGQGFTIPEEPKNEKKRKKGKKGKSIVTTLIWIISIIVISVGLAFGIIFAGADFTGIGFGRGANTSINVEKGTSASQIAEQLKESGAVKLPYLFRAYCKLKGYDSQFKYGFYHFNTEAGYEAIAQMHINDGAKAETVEVTIPEGTGINDYTKNVNGEKVTVPGIATLLEKAGVCTRSDFLIALDEVKFDTKLLKNVNEGKVYHELEGYLFPETYEFYKLDSEQSASLVVERMIGEAEKRITDEMYNRANELGFSMNEVLTLASIVQMESGKATDEMANVAGVFYNRLKSDAFSTLGSSPTCYYGDSFKYDDGRYNTYNIEGLPPGPLCSPGIDAINAVLYPAENSEYYYFVTDKNGKFYYHKTLAEQEKTIKSLQQGNNWIYEYFD